jgi:hypothetical protein
VIKSVLKCQDARMKSFNSCKKNALKAGVTDPAQLADCIGDDGKSKIAKACGKISGDVTKKCSGQDVAALFPGCGASTTGELTTCLETAADCRACAAIKNADGLDATCSACIPSGAIGEPICTYDGRSWCIGGDRDGEPCTDALLNSDCPGGGNCLALSSAFVYLNDSGNFGLSLPSAGARVRHHVGIPDPNTGLASFDCELLEAPPLDFGPLIGVACLAHNPIPGCGDTDMIDCDGGTVLDRDIFTDHNIGDCGLTDDPNETDPNNLLGPSECDALCGPYCDGLPGDYILFKSGCEGYCRYGDKDGVPCLNDLDCVVQNPNSPPDPEPLLVEQSGECVGGEPVAHAHRCQCECQSLVGKRSNPGDFICDEQFITVVESNLPCDRTDPTLVTLSCNPRTSAALITTIMDANAVEGAIITHPPVEGWAGSCAQMAAGDLSAQRKVGTTASFDGGLGDQVSTTDIQCE